MIGNVTRGNDGCLCKCAVFLYAMGGATGFALRIGLKGAYLIQFVKDLLRAVYSNLKVVSISHGHINKKNTSSFG